MQGFEHAGQVHRALERRRAPLQCWCDASHLVNRQPPIEDSERFRDDRRGDHLPVVRELVADVGQRAAVEAGMAFLQLQAEQWAELPIDALPIATEMILPYLIEQAIAAIAQHRPDAVIVSQTSLFFAEKDRSYAFERFRGRPIVRSLLLIPWSLSRVVSRQEMLESLAARYGPIEPIVEDSSAPADRFRLPDGTTFGIISSTTAPFCRSCDRSRLTADGLWYMCLYAPRGLDLRAPLRAGASPEMLQRLVEHAWAARTDRGAEP